MTRMIGIGAAAAVASLCVAGTEYEPDEDGIFDIGNPDHIRKAKMMGLVEYDQATHRPVDQSPERVASDTDNRVAELEATVESQKKTIEAQQETIMELQGRLDATDVPDEAADATGDTSADTGDVPDRQGAPDGDEADNAKSRDALLKEAFEQDPKFGEMTRDQKVEWLATVGVTVPGNIGNDKADEAIKAVYNDYNEEHDAEYAPNFEEAKD